MQCNLDYLLDTVFGFVILIERPQRIDSIQIGKCCRDCSFPGMNYELCNLWKWM